MTGTRIILASGSAIRARILSNAGIDFTAQRPEFDEDAAKADLRSQNPSAAMQASTLAEGKALACKGSDSDVVIGADQVLECAGVIMDKPRSIGEARERLWQLRGKEHRLFSAWAIVRAGQILAAGIEVPVLTMREFTPQFLDFYLDKAGSSLTTTVGAYEFEGLGAQLFAAVRGDYYAILGLPLLPLLAKLREYGAIEA